MDPSVPRPPKRGGLAEDVVSYVRELILTGSLKPGTHIDQEAIGEALGVSRSPVREAIVVLGQEGLLDVLPRRGAQVAHISREDVIDHYELFGLVSGRAAAVAAEGLSDEDLTRLRSLHEQFEKGGDFAADHATTDRVAADRAANLSSLNAEFHRVINRSASARTRWLLGLLDRTVPSRYFEFADGWDQQAVQHHASILQAIVNGDSQAARQAMEHHLHQSGVAAADALEAQGFWNETQEPASTGEH